MANSADIERATKGRDAWNEWAREQLGAGKAPVADFSDWHADPISFMGFVFPGPAIFAKATFAHEVSFKDAEFFQTASFSHARFGNFASFSGAIFRSDVAIDRVGFGGDVDFNKVQFKKDAYIVHTRFTGFVTFQSARCENLDLRGSEFRSEAHFEHVWLNYSEFTGATFKHSLTKFTGASFEHVPDFRAVTFAAPPLFQDVEVKYAKHPGPKFWRRRFSCAASEHDAARFRRLKQLASDWRDHERELEFFAKELRAKRFYETKSWHAIALNLAYGCFSDFGQSVWRPFLWLLGLTLFAAAVSLLLEYWPMFAVMMERFRAAFVLSFTDAALLLGSDRWEIRRDACDVLYGHPCKFGLGAGLLAYLQSAASLFLLFLLGLGSRNRFRTGST